MNKKDTINWEYSPCLFSEKKFPDGSPDIEGQKNSDAVLWFNTLFTKPKENSPSLGTFSPDDFEQKCKQLDYQQSFLKRYICSLSLLGVEAGSQKANVYQLDKDHTIAQLISGGGRIGVEFETRQDSEKFLSFLFQDSKALEKLLHLQNEDTSSDLSKKLGLSQRISTHNQYFDESKKQWIEAQTLVESATCLQLNFPMGGIGNKITEKESGATVKESIIGFEGESTVDGKSYQLGTMLLKLDREKDGKVRVLIGFESVSPHRTNQFGKTHVITTSSEGATKESLAAKADNRSLTGQSKGKYHGMFKQGTMGGLKVRKTNTMDIENLICRAARYINNPNVFKEILSNPCRKEINYEKYQPPKEAVDKKAQSTKSAPNQVIF